MAGRIWYNKCPHCNKPYEFGFGMEGYCRLGFENVVCPNKKCGRIIRTHCDEWNHMSTKQKAGYIFSLSFVLYLIGSLLFCAFILSVDKPSKGFSENQVQAALWLIPVPVYLQIMKSIRIWRSKTRCPEGMKEMTLGEQKWHIKYFVISMVLILGGASTMYFGNSNSWVWIDGFIFLIMGIKGMYLFFQTRWEPVITDQIPSNVMFNIPSVPGTSIQTNSTTEASDDWSRKHGF